MIVFLLLHYYSIIFSSAKFLNHMFDNILFIIKFYDCFFYLLYLVSISWHCQGIFHCFIISRPTMKILKKYV